MSHDLALKFAVLSTAAVAATARAAVAGEVALVYPGPAWAAPAPLPGLFCHCSKRGQPSVPSTVTRRCVGAVTGTSNGLLRAFPWEQGLCGRANPGLPSPTVPKD